jgi:hypothetical protein
VGFTEVERTRSPIEPPTPDRPITPAAHEQRPPVKLAQHKRPDTATVGIDVLERAGGTVEPPAPDRPITEATNEQRPPIKI